MRLYAGEMREDGREGIVRRELRSMAVLNDMSDPLVLGNYVSYRGRQSPWLSAHVILIIDIDGA